MQIIGLLNTKGGAGKTTLTTCLAVRAADEARVAVLDLDPQASFSEWHARRGLPGNPALLPSEDRASDVLGALSEGSHDYLFLDGPPGSLIVTEDAVKISTLVVMPMRASSLDLSASQDCISICHELGVPCLAVLNARTQHDGKLIEQARQVLDAWKVPVAHTVVAQRLQYVNAVTTGKTGAEKDRKAAEEIDALWGEIKAHARKAAKGRVAR